MQPCCPATLPALHSPYSVLGALCARRSPCAGDVQVVKAIAIARKNIEEEAIDLTCKPEFTEVNDNVTAVRMLLLVEQT